MASPLSCRRPKLIYSGPSFEFWLPQTFLNFCNEQRIRFLEKKKVSYSYVLCDTAR